LFIILIYIYLITYGSYRLKANTIKKRTSAFIYLSNYSNLHLTDYLYIFRSIDYSFIYDEFVVLQNSPIF